MTEKKKIRVLLTEDDEREEALLREVLDRAARGRYEVATAHSSCRECQFRHLAYHDPLTGLPNRADFLDHLRRCLARNTRREGDHFAVLFLDLDHFKMVNDTLGHAAGDALLVGFSRRLRRCTRPEDTVARLSGDEFSVLLEEIHGPGDALRVALRLQEQMLSPFRLNGQEVFSSASIGIAFGGSEYARAEDVLRDADTAMYRAKQSGGARHVIFDHAMHAAASAEIEMEMSLRDAVRGGRILPEFEAVADIESRRVLGHEALARWYHQDGSVTPASTFIRVAESSGLILPLGERILIESCAFLRRKIDSGKIAPNHFVSVNVSRRQILQSSLVSSVVAALERFRLEPHNLRLEVREGALLQERDRCEAVLGELKRFGIPIMLDDFGTGVSSITILQQMPIDAVKIDWSVIESIGTDPRADRAVRALIAFASDLGLSIVAEGVTSEAHLQKLCGYGCTLAQGPWISTAEAVESAFERAGDGKSGGGSLGEGDGITGGSSPGSTSGVDDRSGKT